MGTRTQTCTHTTHTYGHKYKHMNTHTHTHTLHSIEVRMYDCNYRSRIRYFFMADAGQISCYSVVGGAGCGVIWSKIGSLIDLVLNRSPHTPYTYTHTYTHAHVHTAHITQGHTYTHATLTLTHTPYTHTHTHTQSYTHHFELIIGHHKAVHFG